MVSTFYGKRGEHAKVAEALVNQVCRNINANHIAPAFGGVFGHNQAVACA